MICEAPSSRPLRPLLRYHGGKWRLSSWIISHFPKQYRVYTEVYGGGASVLLRKERSYCEIYNVLNGEVINLFRVVQNPKTGKQLQELLWLTPFARREFELAYDYHPDPVESARRLVIRAFMGFGSAAHNSKHPTGFRATADRSGTTPAHDWITYPRQLPALIERLRGVVIENRPALGILRQRDGEDYLHYVDPPYVHCSRGQRQHGNYGAFEMTDAQHRELAAVLHTLRGKVILSGYNSPLYRELFKGWRIARKRTTGNSNCGASYRTEMLWMNY